MPEFKTKPHLDGDFGKAVQFPFVEHVFSSERNICYVLLSDLHMPGAADGFTVVSAMRHTNLDAVTLMYTGYPALKEAMSAILLQTDEILLKPLAPPDLVAHPLPLDAHRQRVQRLVRAATGTEPVREAIEVDLIDLVEDRHHGLLNDFVLQRCDAQRTLPSVSLRYKDSS